MSGIANPDLHKAMMEARRSNACAPRINKARQAKKGVGKGGRKAWKSSLAY